MVKHGVKLLNNAKLPHAALKDSNTAQLTGSSMETINQQSDNAQNIVAIPPLDLGVDSPTYVHKIVAH